VDPEKSCRFPGEREGMKSFCPSSSLHYAGRVLTLFGHEIFHKGVYPQ
jgi:hypothetical protein